MIEVLAVFLAVRTLIFNGYQSALKTSRGLRRVLETQFLRDFATTHEKYTKKPGF
jgi:hypothetical protein